MIALDTNLLIYAHRAGVPEHARAQRSIEQALGHPLGCGIALPCAAEFFSIVTHPTATGRPSTATEAGAFLRLLEEEGGARWLAPGPSFASRLAQTAADLGVAGARIFDVQVALCSLDGGATELWTHDAGFVHVPGLRLHDPLSRAGK